MQNNTGKPKLLIVEDDQDNQKFLRMFLKRDFEVEICESEKTFYNKIENNEFDIFLMDISLKGDKDGLELTKELRNMPEYKDVPVVCLSAHAFKKDKDNALNAGATIFLTKPIENKLLLETLKSVLNNR